MCPPMWTHSHHLANTNQLVLLSAHPNPQPKWQIDWFNRFCTAYGRKSLYFTMGDPFPKNCLFSWGYLDPHLIRDSLGQSEPTVQTALRSVQLFSHRWPQRAAILYNGKPLLPSKFPLLVGRSGSPSNMIWCKAASLPHMDGSVVFVR